LRGDKPICFSQVANSDGSMSKYKRPRSPTHSTNSGLSWQSYDVDLLDNVRTTKRFASEAAALDMGGMSLASSRKRGVEVREISSGHAPGAEPMACSSAECSPAVTPLVRSVDAAPAAPIGWITPQRVVGNGTPAAVPGPPKALLAKGSVALSTADCLPTSPTDPQLGEVGDRDLRKQTLMRILMSKHELGMQEGESGQYATPRRRRAAPLAASRMHEVRREEPAARSMECSPMPLGSASASVIAAPPPGC
jgi:hypothetical protein